MQARGSPSPNLITSPLGHPIPSGAESPQARHGPLDFSRVDSLFSPEIATETAAKVTKVAEAQADMVAKTDAKFLASEEKVLAAEPRILATYDLRLTTYYSLLTTHYLLLTTGGGAVRPRGARAQGGAQGGAQGLLLYGPGADRAAARPRAAVPRLG